MKIHFFVKPKSDPDPPGSALVWLPRFGSGSALKPMRIHNTEKNIDIDTKLLNIFQTWFYDFYILELEIKAPIHKSLKVSEILPRSSFLCFWAGSWAAQWAWSCSCAGRYSSSPGQKCSPKNRGSDQSIMAELVQKYWLIIITSYGQFLVPEH